MLYRVVIINAHWSTTDNENGSFEYDLLIPLDRNINLSREDFEDNVSLLIAMKEAGLSLFDSLMELGKTSKAFYLEFETVIEGRDVRLWNAYNHLPIIDLIKV